METQSPRTSIISNKNLNNFFKKKKIKRAKLYDVEV